MESLVLDEIAVVDFRCFEKLDLELGPRFNVVSGNNGVGKTNLLEAVYLLGSLRSFRTTAREEIVRHGAERAELRGVFGGPAAGLEMTLSLSASERRVRSSGKRVLRFQDHFRTLPMVLFHPSTTALVQSGPEMRRRFLDRALFQAEPEYPTLHRDFQRVLKSRNRLLAERRVDRRALAPYDSQFARLAARLVEHRHRFVDVLAPLFQEAFFAIGSGAVASLLYQPKMEGDAQAMEQALAARVEADASRGHTTAGPHADDLAVLLGDRPARKLASQGQQRMLALALKIAETRAVCRACGRVPILLLDDISSELDRERNQALFSFLAGEGGQVIITTTHLDHILIREERTDFVLENGRLVA